MTSDRREKALSVFLSTIMVLSVVAMGMAAGFAGSAAAQPSQDTDNVYGAQTSISANPADLGASSTHTITLVANDSWSSDELQEINVSYGSDFGNLGSISLSEVTVYTDGSEYSEDGAVSNPDTGFLSIDLTNQGSGAAGPSISDGETITVEIQTVTNPSTADAYDIGVGLGKDVGTVDNDQEETVDLELPGPVERLDSSGASQNNYTLIGDAVADASDGDTIEVADGEYREHSGSSQLAGTITGFGSANVSVEAGGSDAVLNVSGADYVDIDVNDVTVDGFTFEGDGDGVAAVTDSSNPLNTTVSNNEFKNFSAAVVTLTPGGDGTDAITTTVSENDFTEGISANAIDIDLANTNDGDTVEVHSNTITGLSGASNNGVELTGSAGGASAVDIQTLTVESDGNGAGLHLQGNTLDTVASLDVDGLDVNNTASGISSAGSDLIFAEDVNITNVEVTNANNGIDLGELDDTNNIRITETTGDGIDVSETGIDVGSSGAPNANLDIHNVDINGSNTGIDAQNEDEFLNVSGVVMTNVGDTVGINVAGDASDVNIDGVEIDGDVDNTNAIDIASGGVAGSATIDINGSTISSVQNGIVFAEDSKDDLMLNITDNTIEDSGTGLDVQEDAGEGTTEPITAIHFNTFENNTVGVNVADAFGGGDRSLNLTFNDFVDNTDGLAVGTVDTDGVNANYNWWGATNGPSGSFNGNGSSVTYSSASDISINPATVKKDDGNVALEQDFLGVVKDSQNVTLNGSSSDATYSFSTNDSDTVPGASNSAEVDGTLVLGLNGTDYVFKDALNEGEVNTSVSGAEADSGKNGTSIANTTPTGDTAITVVGNNSTTAVDDTGSVTLVHEAVGLSEGFNLKSVPQPAKLYTQDVDATNQWDSDDDTYESPDISQGEDVDSGTNLHRGLYVDAASSDARLGYSFATSEVPSPADVVMGNGWHLVGSNFDINSESGTRELDVDLRNVENVTTDGSPGVTAYDSGLSGDIAGSSDINEYDTYWVYVDGEQTRVIVAPNYDPNGR